LLLLNFCVAGKVEQVKHIFIPVFVMISIYGQPCGHYGGKENDVIPDNN